MKKKKAARGAHAKQEVPPDAEPIEAVQVELRPGVRPMVRTPCLCTRCEAARFERWARDARALGPNFTVGVRDTLITEILETIRIRSPLGLAVELCEVVAFLSGGEVDDAADVLEEMAAFERRALALNPDLNEPCQGG